VRSVLTPDLLRPEYRTGARRPYAGHCYAASEAYYHLRGGRLAGFTPMTARHEGESHWWLRGPRGEIIDLTAEQFAVPVPYGVGRGCGFLTGTPSRRAQIIIERVRVRYPDLATRSSR